MLHIGQPQVGAAAALTAHLGRFAQGSNDHVRLPGYLECFIQQLLLGSVVAVERTAEQGSPFLISGIAHEVAAFGITDVGFACRHFFQSLY